MGIGGIGMKTITLENGTKVQISDESYEALQKAVQKSVWKDVVKERAPSKVNMNFFSGWYSYDFSWINNAHAQKEFNIYLYMLLWKETYDKDFEPDWEDNQQKKYYVSYSHYYKRWIIDYSYLERRNMQVYVSSEEKVEQMLKDLQSIGVL